MLVFYNFNYNAGLNSKRIKENRSNKTMSYIIECLI